VALEFHTLREHMPFFFKSQLGNKLWCAGRQAGGALPLALLVVLLPALPPSC
jgi:hypothetical protein